MVTNGTPSYAWPIEEPWISGIRPLAHFIALSTGRRYSPLISSPGGRTRPASHARSTTTPESGAPTRRQLQVSTSGSCCEARMSFVGSKGPVRRRGVGVAEALAEFQCGVLHGLFFSVCGGSRLCSAGASAHHEAGPQGCLLDLSALIRGTFLWSGAGSNCRPPILQTSTQFLSEGCAQGLRGKYRTWTAVVEHVQNTSFTPRTMNPVAQGLRPGPIPIRDAPSS